MPVRQTGMRCSPGLAQVGGRTALAVGRTKRGVPRGFSVTPKLTRASHPPGRKAVRRHIWQALDTDANARNATLRSSRTSVWCFWCSPSPPRHSAADSRPPDETRLSMMDYQTADAGPSRPAVGSAFLFREGDAAAAGPIWDPAFAGISAAVPLPLNPFSFVASESSHHGHHGHHGHAAAAAATPTTGAPPAWGLHAARAHAAPRVWPGIDTISNLSPGAAPGWMTPTPAPVAAQAAVAAQMFGYPPGSVGAMNWAAFPVQLSPTSTQHTLAGTAVGLRPVASLGHHDPASDFAQLPSPPQAPWVNTAGSSALDTRPRVAKFLPPSTRDVDTTLDLIAAQIGHSGPTSQQWPPAFYPPPVNPSERHHSADLSGARSSTSSTHGSVSSATVVHPSPPRPQPTARSPEAPSNTLAIVQYDPNTETRSSTKRPASEELTPNGMGSKTVKQVVVRDENGEVRGVKITFGARAKARAAFTEAQRQRTAQARKEGVCSRCKKSKRQVWFPRSARGGS